MRWIFAAATAAISAAGLLAFEGSPTEAAVLSVGRGYPPFGGFTCADVGGGNPTPGTTVQAWDCLAGPNQQFEFYGGNIYAMGGQVCLDVVGGGGTPGEKVQTDTSCAGGWNYDQGAIHFVSPSYNPPPTFCLDAGNMANGTQLVVNVCNFSDSQFWEIK